MTTARMESIESRRLFTAFVVNTLSDSAADAVGASDGRVSLREALTAANTNAAYGDAAAGQADGDTITFSRSLNGRTLRLGNGQLVITDDVAVSGSVTIDGRAASRLFKITAAGNVLLNGLTMTNGRDRTADGGGAVYTAGTTLRIENGVVENNSAYLGGGIVALSGRVGLYRTTVRDNTAVPTPTGDDPVGTYIGLGDSITFGETDLRYLPNFGKANGYPVLVDADLANDNSGGRALNLFNLAIDGETADSFMDNSGRTPPVVGRTDSPLQLQNRNYPDTTVSQQQKFFSTVKRQQRAGRDIKFVSITLGFNELAALSTLPNGASLIDSTLATYKANYTQVLANVTRATPGAQLVVLNYFNPFPADNNTNPAKPIFDAAGTRLNAIIQQLAAQFGATYVDTATPFVGKEAAYTYLDEVGAGDTVPQPHAQGDNGVAPIGNVHPNATGYRVIADQVIAALAASRPAGQPGDGGGINVGGRTRLSVARGEISGNTAGGGRRASGGGAFIDDNATATFSGVTVRGNRAFYRGGGLFTDGTLTAAATNVVSNRARIGGGLFATEDATTSLAEDVLLQSNRPDDSSGLTATGAA